ncbi:TPA: helix-turn-helix domain-containing protein [Klebsiella variicola]|nr:helix-turn-helix domain-containing protein [Klebsiella variicola]
MDELIRRIAAESMIKHIEQENCYHLIVASGRQEIQLYENNICYHYCLRAGEIEIRRLSDDIVVSYLKAPDIVGLSTYDKSQVYHYIKTISNVELLAIKHENFYRMIEEKKLWQEAFTLSIYMLNINYIRDEALASRNVYGIVRHYIEIFWSMEEERSRFSIFEFILSRTNISRSSLNKILKDLCLGGYIKMERGKLIDKKNLPLNY